MKKRFFILFSLILLNGCSRELVEKMYDVDYGTTNRFAKNLAPLPGQFTKDAAALDRLLSSFNGKVKRYWGDNDALMASKRQYVKYTDGYQSRTHVDFERGVVIVETVAKTEPEKHLREAITTTLLTPDNPAGVDLYSDLAIELRGKPFLYGLLK